MKSGHLNVLKINQHNLWMKSHCAAPLPYQISNDKLRIYFSSRDCSNNLRVASAVYSIPENIILYIEDEPVIDIGQEGFFDSNAIYPSEILEINQELYLYYAGRSAGANKTYYVSLGLAISKDNGKSFKRFSDAPIMERSTYDPWMVGPCAIIRSNNNLIMLYTSGFMFDSLANSSKYDIKQAISNDGITWKRNGLICIPSKDDISNVAAPSIIKIKGIFHMWFCNLVNSNYRIGYAKSEDLINWDIRYEDEHFKGIEAAYPKAILVKDKVFVFYSAGKYGADGINLFTINSEKLS